MLGESLYNFLDVALWLAVFIHWQMCTEHPTVPSLAVQCGEEINRRCHHCGAGSMMGKHRVLWEHRGLASTAVLESQDLFRGDGASASTQAGRDWVGQEFLLKHSL